MSAEMVRVVLEVARSVDPISGRVVHEDGTDARFDGWLELLTLLEQLRAGVPRSTQGFSERGDQADAGADPELAVDVAEVHLHGLRTEEQ